MTMPLADHFLAGSLLTLLVPVALLALIVVWWAVFFHRDSRRKSR
jgi:hypothetical protein